MDRKSFIKSAYSKYWMTAREKRYGFLAYDKSLCRLVCQSVAQGGSLLDVGVGTGYPFAQYFDQKGYQVHGVDLSPDLISKCQKLYPTVKSKVGDAEALDFPSESFDGVYCFHSTWYSPNLEGALNEMLRVTKPGGIIAFDIQNARNPNIARSYQKRLNERSGIGMVRRQLKNVAKTLLRRGVPT